MYRFRRPGSSTKRTIVCTGCTRHVHEGCFRTASSTMPNTMCRASGVSKQFGEPQPTCLGIYGGHGPGTNRWKRLGDIPKIGTDTQRRRGAPSRRPTNCRTPEHMRCSTPSRRLQDPRYLWVGASSCSSAGDRGPSARCKRHDASFQSWSRAAQQSRALPASMSPLTSVSRNKWVCEVAFELACRSLALMHSLRPGRSDTAAPPPPTLAFVL